MPDPRPEPAVGPAPHVFPSDQIRIAHQPLGHQVRMLDEVGAVTNHAGDQGGSFGKLRLLKDISLMFMAWIRCLDRKTAGIHLEDDVDHVTTRDAQRLRAFTRLVGARRKNPRAFRAYSS